MMRSLFSGVSGLKNHQTRMDVIGNNISNVNTTGFKSSRVTFTDMLAQNLSGASSPNDNIGGTNPKQIGLGSAVGAVDLLFTNGSVQSTGVNTDLALSSSNALFILDTGSGTAYTRNGDFQFDADGNYVQAGNGYYVQGWMANNGAIDTGAQVTNITIPSGKTMPPKASEMAKYTNNLNAEVPTITKISYTTNTGGTIVTHDITASNTPLPAAIDPTNTDGSKPTSATMTLSDGSTLTLTSGIYSTSHSMPIVTTLSVYDTLGSVHDLSVYFTLTNAASDTWEVALTNDGETSKTWQEDDGSWTTVTMTPVPLQFTTSGAFDGGTGSPTLTLTNGSEPTQTIQLNFEGLTQYSSSSTVAGKADGNAAGVLSSISIDKTGTITGTYTNGMKQTEAQVALQRFTNPGGLNKIGESLYEDSNNSGKSGEPSTASALGATITPSALEMSNVDVANEFTDMIITQRGFQSNSKIITVSDEMLETIVNMKR
jgi:flagellar hook protein FlgE